MKTKTCTKCNKEKSVDKFSKKKSSSDGYRYQCKDCHNKYNREKWYPKNRQKQIKSSNKWKKENKHKVLSYRNNLDPEKIKNLLENSDGHCAICHQEKDLCVDHCHDTGKIRDLLCDSCNRGIGFFEENVYYLKRAIKYIKKHNK